VIRTHFNLSVLFLLLLLALPVWAAPAGAEGQMTEVKGNVSLVRNQAPPVQLRKNDMVQAGDEILTGHKSLAAIRMPDGSTVRIYPDSHVVFRSETGSWKEFLHVFLGTVRVQIEKISGRPNPKTLTTPTAIIAVRGTIFSVLVDRNGDTQVGVGEGLVSVASQIEPKNEVLLKPGQSCWMRHGQQRPSQPQMMMQPMQGLWGCCGWDGMGMQGQWDMGNWSGRWGSGMDGRTGSQGNMGSRTGSQGNMGQNGPHH
jgi:ferric-dicitrate binding protein FerR (iron transport regulator)